MKADLSNNTSKVNKSQINGKLDDSKFLTEGDLSIVRESKTAREDIYRAVSPRSVERNSARTPVLGEKKIKERKNIKDPRGVYGNLTDRQITPKGREGIRNMNTPTRELSKTQRIDREENSFDQQNRQTMMSTIVLPQDGKINPDEDYCGNSETLSHEESFDTHADTPKEIRNLFIASKPSESQETIKKNQQKSKFNLEVYILVENILRTCKEALLWGQSPVEACNKYIEMASKKDVESFEKIFKLESEIKLVKSSFILEKLAIPLILYFTIEVKANKTAQQLLKSLSCAIHENYLLFGYFVSLKLKDKTRLNFWTEKLLDLLEMEESSEGTKTENLKRMKQNNASIIETMKNLIGVLQNKEIMYGFNSIIVQLDKINIHEAYSRLLKCLSVYMSEKELKGPTISPPKSAINKKTIIKEEKSPRPITTPVPTREKITKPVEERNLRAEEIMRSKQPLTKTTLIKPEKKKVIKKEPSHKVIKPVFEPKKQVEVEAGADDKIVVHVEDIEIDIGDIAYSYYLPRLSNDGGKYHKYTLVMDLDETLVHYIEIPGHYNELRVRPYVDYFLQEVSQYYEVIVFTTGTQEYADWVLDNIDRYDSVSHRLYRQHASLDTDSLSFMKDLARLGRDLSKVIIVDNLPENFRLQPDNGIAIKPWYDDHEDNALLELAPLLVNMALRQVPDVRVALRKFREQMIQNIENGCEDPHLNITLD